MPRFYYTARDAAGAEHEGYRTTGSRAQLAQLLLSDGLNPVRIEVANASGSGGRQGLPDWVPVNRVALHDLELFCRQAHALTRAGVPIVQGLRSLVETTHQVRLRKAVQQVVESLESGRDLSTGMSQHPYVFSNLMVKLVRIGETSGRLEQAFSELAFYLSRERETRKQIKQAIRYPMFVISTIIMAIVILNYFVIPAFAAVFDRFDAELPLPTRILIETSEFSVDHGAWILLGAVLSFLGFRVFIATERGRLWWDRLKLHIPIVGSIMKQALLGRFARALTMSTRSGVPVLDALESIGEATDNAYMERHVNAMRERLERGESLLGAAASTRLFTPLVLQILAVGEETGRVDDMMEEVARFYEQEVDYQLKNLSSTIEPLLIGVVGVLVLILALGVFLPIWDLGTAAL